MQGLPSGIQNSVISLANVIVQSNINSFGANAMAGCGAYSKVEGFAFLPVTCFAMALATFVSQNVGAGQPDRVRKGMKFGILCSIAMAEVVGVCIYLASPWLIGAFSGEPDVIAFGVQQAHTAALFYCLLAFSHCCAGILRGLGRPGGAHDGHAGGLVRAAHHLHHNHAASYPCHRRGILGLPADLEHLLAALRVVHPPLSHPAIGRRRTALNLEKSVCFGRRIFCSKKCCFLPAYLP